MVLGAPEHRDSDAYRGYCDAMAGGETSVAQQKRVAKGGREVVMQVACTPVLDAAGKPQRFVELSTDISAESRKHEEARPELEVRPRIMDETSILSVAEKQGDIISYNKKNPQKSKY